MLKTINLNERSANVIKEGLNKLSEPEIEIFCITDEYPETTDVMIHALKNGFNHIQAPAKIRMNDEQIDFIEAMFLNTDKENFINRVLH